MMFPLSVPSLGQRSVLRCLLGDPPLPATLRDGGDCAPEDAFEISLIWPGSAGLLYAVAGPSWGHPTTLPAGLPSGKAPDHP